MGIPNEHRNRPAPAIPGIDVWDPAEVLEAMIEGQFAAVAAVRAARRAIEEAALAMETRLRDGGRLVYVAPAPPGGSPFRTAPS